MTGNQENVVKITISGNASVKGGNGGAADGTGGDGIRGGNLDITLKDLSSVSGGTGSKAGYAINFTSGTKNRLELQSGFTLNGVVSTTGVGTSGTLVFGGTKAGTFDATNIATQFIGLTNLEKIGSSTWTLTGTTRAVREMRVKDGRLLVDGRLDNVNVTVDAGAIIGGTGVVGSLTINGGTLEPGNPIGSFDTVGNLILDANSTYKVDVSPTGADKVNVIGLATLGGAKVAVNFQPGTYVKKQHIIISAEDGISGTFGPKVDTNLPKNLKAGLSYSTSEVFLNLTLDYSQPTTSPETTAKPGAPSSDSSSKADGKGQASSGAGAASPAPTTPNRGLNPNQTSAANALTAYFNSNGGIPMIFGGLTAQGLSQVAGEPVTAVQTNASAAITQFMGALTDGVPGERGISLAAGPAGFASYSSAKSGKTDRPGRPVAITPDPDLWRWSVWGSGFGGVQFHGADAVAGTAAATNRIYGAAVGADYRLATNTTLGFALGGGATSFNSFGLGSGSSDLFQAGLFLRQQHGRELSLGLRRLRLAGCHHRPDARRAPTICRAASTPTAMPAGSRPGTSSASPASASRPTPPPSSACSRCRAIARRRCRAGHLRALLRRQGHHPSAQRTGPARRPQLTIAGLD